jgi:ESS family glutamate:Na+ symporter
MENSFIPYLIAFMWMSVLLLVAVWLRSKIKFLQTFLVPSCITAGVLGAILMNCGLVGYPSPNGWVPLKMGDFGLISFQLFSFGFGIIGLACFPKGSSNRTSKSLIWGALWFSVMFWTFYAMQATVGYGVMSAYKALTGSDLNPANGFLVGLGYAFGPGQTITVAMGWQDAGWADSLSIGLTFVAIGFLVANFVGVPLANWGLRKGYAAYTDCDLSDDFLAGLRPKDKQIIACPHTTHSGNVDTIALHLAVAIMVYAVAWLICYVLKYYVLPTEYHNVSYGMIFMYAVLAGILVRALLNKTPAAEYYNEDAQNRILGTSVDYMILSSLLAVKATAVYAYIVPILITALVCCILTLFATIWFGRRVGAFGLERLLAFFGLITGTAASGMALLRIVDCDFKSPAAAEMGLNNIYSLIPMFPFMLVAVTMPKVYGISGMLIMNGIFFFGGLFILFIGYRFKIWGPKQF